MAESKYNAVFQWPSTGPQRVIVTGNFDNWSCSVPLTKTSDGFEVSVPVPYDHEVVYKFIVDGNWIADDKKPKQYDGRGIVNNVLRTPKAPEPEPVPAPTPPTVDELVSVPAIDATPEATASVAAPEILVKDQVDAQATPAPVVPEPPTAPLPIAAPNQHPVDIVPEASTTSGPETVEDVKPESSVPIVEVLPVEGALPETAPVEVAATVPVVEPLPVPADEPLAGPAKAAAIEPLLAADKVEVPVSESILTKVDEAITEPSAPTSVGPVQDKPIEPTPEKSDAAETGANKPGESAEGKPAARDSSEAKPRLNGVGSPKEKGSHKRSSTFGSIRSKVFPSADEEANKPENRSVSSLGKGATREKRKSIFKRVTSIFKQSS